jgi:hypothetical protein
MTHKQHLLAWFRRGLSITPAVAVGQWSNYRLADTVYQLRQDGHHIHTQTMERMNDDGRRVTWARYSYISGPNGEAVSADMPAFIDPDPAEREGGGMRKVWTAIFGGEGK